MSAKVIKIGIAALLLVLVAGLAAYSTTLSTPAASSQAKVVCPCDCGCAASGVCKCGEGCPCKCGCGKSGVCGCGKTAACSGSDCTKREAKSCCPMSQ
jgi:hypothetical protein